MFEGVRQAYQLTLFDERHDMWVFLTSRLRTWIIFAIAVPLATALLSLIRRRLEAKRGQTRLVRALTKLENLGRRRQRTEQARHR